MNEALTFDDVLIKPKLSYVSSRSTVSLRNEEFGFNLPVISANMDSITSENMVKTMFYAGGLGILHRNMPVDQGMEFIDYFLRKKIRFGITVGSLDNDFDRINSYVDMMQDSHSNNFLCIDMAHGHSQNMQRTLAYIREEKKYKGLLIAGNVCTKEAVNDLARWGANIAKVGVGPGSICITREMTGCGIPQFTALERIKTKTYYNGEGRSYSIAPAIIPIIADGGLKTPGDICKALVYADFVMIGGMLAGTDATPNWKDDKSIVSYHGMASKKAKVQDDYIEGEAFQVQSKSLGSTEQVLKSISQGLQSACSYVGALNLQEFKEKAEFIRVSASTIRENKAHFND